MGWQIHCSIHCSCWFRWSAWLLCMGWQIHCPVLSRLSDLTALCGLTDPLSKSTVLVCPDSLTWLFCMGLWFNISAAQGCWGLELNKHTNHLHESSITWKLYIIQSHVHVNSVTEIQSCSEFQPLNSCAHPRIFFFHDSVLSCGHLFMGWNNYLPAPGSFAQHCSSDWAVKLQSYFKGLHPTEVSNFFLVISFCKVL